MTGKRYIKTFRDTRRDIQVLSCELIMIMPFIIQSALLHQTLHGSDLSHSFLAKALLTLKTRKGPYTLCLHATQLQWPHETFCQHAFMSTGWGQRYIGRLLSVSCLWWSIWMYLSVYQRSGTKYNEDVQQVGEALICQERPTFLVKTVKFRKKN